MSVGNLVYLSSEQALADLASFRQFIADQFNLTDSNKWVSFGGSYPGMVALLCDKHLCKSPNDSVT